MMWPDESETYARTPESGDCKHGSIDDFSRTEKWAGKTVRFWKCCGCGKEDRWGKEWAVNGTVECRRCGVSSPITWVACSRACRKLRKA